MKHLSKKEEQDFYQQTRKRDHAKSIYDGVQKSTGIFKAPLKELKYYIWVAEGLGIGLPLFIAFVIHSFCMFIGSSLGNDEGFFHSYGDVFPLTIFLVISIWALRKFFRFKFKAMWYNNNAKEIGEDLYQFENDSYIQTVQHLVANYKAAPDAGLGFSGGHAGTLLTHIFCDNDGIKKIKIPRFDPTVDGFVAKDENGDIIYDVLPMFDHAFGDSLYDMSEVPREHRLWYNTKNYLLDPNQATKDAKVEKSKKEQLEDLQKQFSSLIKSFKEPSSKKKKKRRRVVTSPSKKKKDGPSLLNEYINEHFYPLDSDTQRPAGIYFYDSRPVNTILIAITRAGKGQTYIEAIMDVWMREKEQWNIFTTDPKMELLRKMYYVATKRNYEVIQFNLMVPELSNSFNLLINALQEFRRDEETKGAAIVDSVVTMLFPTNDEIWNSAAGNMLRRIIYLLFDVLIEQEHYIRYVGYRDKIPQEIIDNQIEDNYSKVSMYSVSTLLGDLSSRVSSDRNFININPKQPPVAEKDFLTLLFDAMSMLPPNSLRRKAINANNKIKQMAGAKQTMASVYATLLTGLSIYDDPTTIALLSGGLSESFDVSGIGFPRRFGVRFEQNFYRRYGLAGAHATWRSYADANFTKEYNFEQYGHAESISIAGWTWGHFNKPFPKETTYLTLDIDVDKTRIARYYFKFVKGYKKVGSIAYARDAVTNNLTIKDGLLLELQPIINSQGEIEYVEKVSDFTDIVYNAYTKAFEEQSKPVFVMQQVFYSEQPKFMFAVVPPHLQHYQKHVLSIIKQIVDEFYSLSYNTKSNGKPIVPLAMMLEEAGNIRDGDQGIESIDTITSIALGQNLQITFVLQSFEQFRSIYSAEKESIVRDNSQNIVYLRSSNKELLEELARVSGEKHVSRVMGKNTTYKYGDIITRGEEATGYNTQLETTTALTEQDLLFLAGNKPGNGAVVGPSTRPILNKNDTIMPMVGGYRPGTFENGEYKYGGGGLHRQIPEPVSGYYTKATLPTTANRSNISSAQYVIDGDGLVMARVQQAKIAQTIQKDALRAAKKAGIVLDEFSEDLSRYIMNAVYDEYYRSVGISLSKLANKPVIYWEDAKYLMDLYQQLADSYTHESLKREMVSELKQGLMRVITDPNLEDLTADLRSQSEQNMLGFNLEAVSIFLKNYQAVYSEPEKLDYEKQDVFELAKDGVDPTTGRKYVDRHHKLLSRDEQNQFRFNLKEITQREAFETVLDKVAAKQVRFEGLALVPFKNAELMNDVLINGQQIGVADFTESICQFNLNTMVKGEELIEQIPELYEAIMNEFMSIATMA